MNDQELELAILKGLCYFDVHDYPLTLLEIRRFLFCPAELPVISQALADPRMSRLIGCRDGFYFLAGREAIVANRLRRYSPANGKFRYLRLVLRCLRFVPWLRAVAVYSSLSFSNVRPGSDLDLFVVAKSGRVWSCRFFVNLFLKLFRLRPGETAGRHAICVSFLVAADSLSLQKFVNEESQLNYTFGTSQFLFLYSEDGLEQQFWQDNLWLKDSLPNWSPAKVSARRRLPAGRSWLKIILENTFSLLSESIFKGWQEKIMPARVKSLANNDYRVVLSDQIIKLHDNDKSQRFQTAFSAKFNQLTSQDGPAT